MKSIKKKLRLLGLILLMSVAALGLGINNAILPVHRRQDINQTKTEMVETKEDDVQDVEVEENS